MNWLSQEDGDGRLVFEKSNELPLGIDVLSSVKVKVYKKRDLYPFSTCNND